MKLSLLTLAIGSLLLGACTHTEKKGEPSGDSTTAVAKPRIELADTLKNRLLTDYLRLKTALVNSDSVEAGAAAGQLAKSLSLLHGCKEASKSADSLAGSASLAVQRSRFSFINQELIPVMKQADVKTGHIYVQFCPMANDGKGGYWLSSDKLIRNPYYGDEMLECGEVKQVIE